MLANHFFSNGNSFRENLVLISFRTFLQKFFLEFLEVFPTFFDGLVCFVAYDGGKNFTFGLEVIHGLAILFLDFFLNIFYFYLMIDLHFLETSRRNTVRNFNQGLFSSF